MKTFTFKFQIHPPFQTLRSNQTNLITNSPLLFTPLHVLPLHTRLTTITPTQILECSNKTTTILTDKPQHETPESELHVEASETGYLRLVMVGAVSIGLGLLLMGVDEQKALALGPEGPLVEEFWDNVRRYALYALTVSTGAIYTIFQPILELLKNPISAILILLIIGGTIYIVSQVLSAMVGVTDFSYTYAY